MSKYNNMKSISISSLSEDEFLQAIKEWSEGSECMEKLLLACKSNGIETFGCHAEANPYVDIVVNNSHDKIRNMLCAVQTVPETQILIQPDGSGNIIATTDWDKPIMGFGLFKQDKQSVESFLNKLSESIIGDATISSSKIEPFEHILDFYDFFVGKEADTMFRLKYSNGQYIFSAEPNKYRNDLTFLNTLFKEAGLTKDINYDGPIDSWELTATTPEEFNEKMIQCKNVIMNGWSLPLPSKIVEGMSDNAIAHVMRRKFGDSTQGKQQFEKWLKEYRTIKQSIIFKGDEASLKGIEEEMKVIEDNRAKEDNDIIKDTK